jgi:type I restriction enzyme S subunit
MGGMISELSSIKIIEADVTSSQSDSVKAQNSVYVNGGSVDYINIQDALNVASNSDTSNHYVVNQISRATGTILIIDDDNDIYFDDDNSIERFESVIGDMGYIVTNESAPTTDITSGEIDWENVPYCKTAPDDIEKYILHDGDIVISRAGSVGYSHLIEKPERAVFASYLIRFKPLINPKYFSYFLKSPFYWQSISKKKLGIAVPNVNATKLKQIFFPLAPQNGQERIVEKIEEIFTKLNAGVQEFIKSNTQLKILHHAIIKDAISGKITRDWRNKNKSVIKPVYYQLEHIKKENNLGDFNFSELSDLYGWIKTTIEDITQIRPTKGSTPTTYGFDWEEDGILFLRSECIKENKLSLKGSKFISKDAHDYMLRSQIKPEDILVRITGDVGISCIFPEEYRDANINQHISVIRLLPNSPINKSYLVHVLNSPQKRKYFHGITRGVTHPHLSLEQVRETPISLPPLQEQNIIVEEIGKRISIIDNLKNIIETNTRLTYLMRQSILKKAFKGELIPQDHSDETAEVLLKRIKNEKGKYEQMRLT